MRRFILLRVEDVSGSSGTGVVARGVVGPNGWVVMFWEDSMKVFADIETMMKVHSHDGRTRFHWQDKEPEVTPEEAPVAREWRPSWGAVFLHTTGYRIQKRVPCIIESIDGATARVGLVGQAAGPMSTTIPVGSLYQRDEMTHLPICDTYLTEAEEKFRSASFGFRGSCGCDGGLDYGCPLCTKDRLVGWLKAIRKANDTFR